MDATKWHLPKSLLCRGRAPRRADSENVRVFAELNAMSSEQIPMLRAKTLAPSHFPRLHCPYSPAPLSAVYGSSFPSILTPTYCLYAWLYLNRLVDQSEMRFSSIMCDFHRSKCRFRDNRKSPSVCWTQSVEKQNVFPRCKHHPWWLTNTGSEIAFVHHARITHAWPKGLRVGVHRRRSRTTLLRDRVRDIYVLHSDRVNA